MKIVINTCYGGFGLSPKAMQRYLHLKGKECHFFIRANDETLQPTSLEDAHAALSHSQLEIHTALPPSNDNYFWHGKIEDRTDPHLVQVVEELSPEVASGRFALLKIVEIPDGINWYIDYYDGVETIREEHRNWD